MGEHNDFLENKNKAEGLKGTRAPILSVVKIAVVSVLILFFAISKASFYESLAYFTDRSQSGSFIYTTGDAAQIVGEEYSVEYLQPDEDDLTEADVRGGLTEDSAKTTSQKDRSDLVPTGGTTGEKSALNQQKGSRAEDNKTADEEAARRSTAEDTATRDKAASGEADRRDTAEDVATRSKTGDNDATRGKTADGETAGQGASEDTKTGDGTTDSKTADDTAIPGKAAGGEAAGRGTTEYATSHGKANDDKARDATNNDGAAQSEAK
ncbi:MAG TPA: hypothetical protein GXZ32_05970 [Clostridiales bacterium]|nr:hypothetical protein [Clostridiales bacterium]